MDKDGHYRWSLTRQWSALLFQVWELGFSKVCTSVSLMRTAFSLCSELGPIWMWNDNSLTNFEAKLKPNSKLVQDSENSFTRAGWYFQRSSYVKLIPVSEKQRVIFFVLNCWKAKPVSLGENLTVLISVLGIISSSFCCFCPHGRRSHGQKQ